MKISLALGPRRELSRQTAWGYLTTNLALPGFGSLMGGRISGYPQAILGVSGMVLTTLFGVRFIFWAVVHWSELYGESADPIEKLITMWLAVRWSLLGMAIFAVGWLWALATSWSLLQSASKNKPGSSVPPVLKRGAS